ncbi:hypothetical protein D3C71_1455070 [compost metagenome]
MSHRLLGRRLHIRVQRGIDIEAFHLQLIRGHAEQLGGFCADIVSEIGSGQGSGLLSPRLQVPRLCFGTVGFSLCDLPKVHHGGQDEVLTLLGVIRVGIWRIIGGPLGDSRQKRAFGQIERSCRFAEIHLRSRINPVGAVAVIDFIQIHAENVVLAVLHFKLERVHRFLGLAGPGLLMRQVQIARQLLGQRACALGAAAVLQIDNNRAAHALEVEAGVLVKFAVLDSERGLDKQGGNLL